MTARYDLLDSADVADYLGITTHQLRTLLKNEVLQPCREIGTRNHHRAFLFDPQEVMEVKRKMLKDKKRIA